MKKEIKEIIRGLKRKGWEVTRTGKHFKAKPPNSNRSITFSGTPSCPYAVKHVYEDIERVEQDILSSNNSKSSN